MMKILTDNILPFQLDNARGRIIRLDTLIKEISAAHNYPPVVNKFMWELITLGILISDMFKFEGLFTLQAIASGPISTLVVDVTSDKHVRACAKFDNDKVALLPLDISVPRAFGAGYMAFTIDQTHEKDRFQGVVELTGETLVECIHHYFRQSEQINVGIRLATTDNMENEKAIAAGILIQQMPEAKHDPNFDTEDDWFRIMSLLGTLSNLELLSLNHTQEDILYRLFWNEETRIYNHKPLIAKCRCSDEKTSSMLKSFSQDDLRHMIHNHMIEVTCEFCSKQYRYDETEVNKWISEK